MYYKKRSTILFRLYDDFGYLTDNRNFGYRYANAPVVGDKILSLSGAIMLQCLGHEARTVEDVAKCAIVEFSGVEYSVLLDDIRELFDELVDGGFLVKGISVEECRQKELTEPSVSDIDIFSVTSNHKKRVEESTQDFLQSHFGDMPFPVSVHLEIVGACNEKCIHCYIPGENKFGVMPIDLFENIVRKCVELNILHITISGGEPLLHPEILTVLSRCRECDMSVNILSNLTMLTDDIAKEMKMNPLLGVQASLYSIDEKVHDSITGVEGSCKRTQQSILELIHLGIPVQISCPIMRQNLDSYRGVVEWGHENGALVSADYVIIGRSDCTTANLKCRIRPEDIFSIIRDELRNPANRAKEEAEVRKNKLRTQDDYICSVCGSSICVGVNGNVFPCAGWQGCVLGNIKNDSLKHIWFSSEKAVWLRSLKRKDITKCKMCKYQEYCALCLVRNANESESGNPLEANEFFCKVAQMKEKILRNGQ